MLDKTEHEKLEKLCLELVYKYVSNGPILPNHSYVYINRDSEYAFSLTPSRNPGKMIFTRIDLTKRY